LLLPVSTGVFDDPLQNLPFVIAGDFAYLANAENGLARFSVLQPASPFYVGDIALTDSTSASDVSVSSTALLVGGLTGAGCGVELFDLRP
jgi:hypothetical protein